VPLIPNKLYRPSRGGPSGAAALGREEVAVPYFVVWRTHRAAHRPGVPSRAVGGAPAGYPTRGAAAAAARGSVPHQLRPLWDEWTIIPAANAVSALRAAGVVADGWTRR